MDAGVTVRMGAGTCYLFSPPHMDETTDGEDDE